MMSAIVGALGHFLYTSGTDRATGSVASYVFNPRLFGRVICYVAVMVMFVTAFKRGGSLAVLYRHYALTLIWAAAIAWTAYSTPINPVNALGMPLIVGGMFFMGR